MLATVRTWFRQHMFCKHDWMDLKPSVVDRCRKYRQFSFCQKCTLGKIREWDNGSLKGKS